MTLKILTFLSLVLMSGVALAEPFLYTNDLGTSSQLSEIMWFRNSMSDNYSTSFPSVLLITSDANDPYTGSSFVATDLDGDLLARIVYAITTVSFDHKGVRPFSASVFKVYDDIEVSAYAASAHENYQTNATGVVLAATRTGYDQTGYAADHAMHLVTVTAGDDFNGSPRFWAGVKITNKNALAYDVGPAEGYKYSRVTDFQVSATERDPIEGEKALLTDNDFGTAEQQGMWAISGTATPLFFTSNESDTNNDLMANGIRFAGSSNAARSGNLSVVLRVDAPEGKLFKNITGTAQAWAWNAWGSSATLELSKDGVNFDVMGNTANNGSVETLLVDSTGVEGYEALSSVWFKISMTDTRGYDYNGDHLYVDNVVLTGELVDLGPIAGPREPLTFRDSGLYCGWNDYFTRIDTPFDFFVVQAVAYEGDTQRNIDWNAWLQAARARGKRIIADLIPQAKDDNDEWYGIGALTSSSDQADLDKLAAVIDEFFEQVDINDVYAITLGEEHIFWNGRTDHLNYLYDKVKATHDVPVYQWYSPSGSGSIPGINYPNLKADGWMADEYFLDQPFMEQGMRGFTVLQKPIIQTIWAGGDEASVPFISTRFGEQYDVCQKYNIPTSYFTWNGTGIYWGFHEDAPQTLKDRFDLVLQAATDAESYSGPDTQTWDTVPWTLSAIPLELTASVGPTACYREVYAVERGVRFVNEATCTGFADLRWDSGAVELRPRQAGSSQASVSYLFESPAEIHQLVVCASGFVTGGRSAAASMSILDSSGSVITTENLSPEGTLNVVVPGDSLSSFQFGVKFDLSGTAQSEGDVLAGIASLDVVVNIDPIVYGNDFGTPGQLNEFLWFETASPETFSTSFPSGIDISADANDPYSSSSFVAANLDDDGLARNLYVTTVANVDVTGMRPVSAEPFKVWDNVEVSGLAASGYPYPQDSATGVILSTTRSGYDATDYATEFNSLQAVNIADGLANGFARFWAGVKVTRAYAYGYDVGSVAGYYYSRLTDFQVSGIYRDPAPGERVLLTDNDFGTPDQRSMWSVSGTATPLFYVINEGDVSNDLLANGIRFAGDTNAARSGELSWVLRVDAPAGKAFKNITGTARAWAQSTWGSSAWLELSKDGVHFDVSGNIANGSDIESLAVDSSGVAGYEGISSVWFKIRMVDTQGYDLGGYHLFVDNIMLTGELVDAVSLTPGDANGDGMVDVGDLGILAANYGTVSGATWAKGDFNADGAVDVGDLGILAANYGMGASSADWDADYAKVFGETLASDDVEADDDDDIMDAMPCTVLGPMVMMTLCLMCFWLGYGKLK